MPASRPAPSRRCCSSAPVGYPQLDFTNAGCSLCGACARACEAEVFDLSREAFPWRAQIDDHCLARAGIHCRSCEDACEPAAIRFRPHPGGPSLAEPRPDPALQRLRRLRLALPRQRHPPEP